MVARCYDETRDHYRNYGGRGISVCSEWKNNFRSFLYWSYENGYKPHLSIERKDNNGNYEPSNCKWANGTEQGRNRRTNRLVTAWGETKCLMEWIEDPRCCVQYATAHYRISIGMNPEEALTVPSTKGKLRPGDRLHSAV